GALVAGPPPAGLPCVAVTDTRRALGDLGRHWRESLALAVVGLTGSNGKTTVKEMIRTILALVGETHATRGNLNNDLGVPLTLLELRPHHRFAVIEMGANHAGEIAYLTRLARPDVALLNNAGPAHLEGFGSLEGVARAKGEIFLNLKPDGVAVINGDDPFNPLWREYAAPRQVVDFSLGGAAAVSGRRLEDGRLAITLADGASAAVNLPLPGEHNRRNALAAAAVCHALDIDLVTIVRGLEGVQGVAGRLSRKAGPFASTIIDDAYNANPASLAAALSALEGERRWLVLGDMNELGAEAPALHARAGEQARAGGFERLYALGIHSRQAVGSFGEGGRHFATVEALNDTLLADLARSGPVTLLIKGSRGMRMERVVEMLLGNASAGEEA
ncbi:MAG: UDP-N-acetylmuramoyl-tripeptide--D-alanyl-D-alanine ligase, partial [Candidatus Competibacteraceae bacterium]|nr:UDP-N-acetylmuramoyl-tripeptide--D-alanyl-D-alanine ligase [Candidatus Competibacteraceae bacterium]